MRYRYADAIIGRLVIGHFDKQGKNMHLNVIDLESIAEQRDLELRHHLRTDYESAMIAAGQSVTRHGLFSTVSKAIGRLRTTSDHN
jgi:putative heme iron utilization protein